MATKTDARNKVRDTRKYLALAHLQTGATVEDTAKQVGVSRKTLWRWSCDGTDPEFAEAYVEAVEIGADVIEDEIRRRATGYDVETAGAIVTKHSDALLMFLACARDPEKYCSAARRAKLEREALAKALDSGDARPSIEALAALETMMRGKAAAATPKKFDA